MDLYIIINYINNKVFIFSTYAYCYVTIKIIYFCFLVKITSHYNLVKIFQKYRGNKLNINMLVNLF